MTVATWGGSGQGTEPLKATQGPPPRAQTLLGAHRPSPAVLPFSSEPSRASARPSRLSVCPDAASPLWGWNPHVRGKPVRGRLPARPSSRLNGSAETHGAPEQALRQVEPGPGGEAGKAPPSSCSAETPQRLSCRGLWGYRLIFGEQESALVETGVD